MARTASDPITTKTDRLALPLSLTPYLFSLKPGRVLGYVRKAAKIPGAWIVRQEVGRTATGPIRRRVTIGTADDFAPANGIDILDYNQARAKALAMIITVDGAEEKKGAFTLEDAIEQHKGFTGRKGNKAKRGKVGAVNSLRWNLLGLESGGEGADGFATLGEVREGYTIISSADQKLPDGPWALDRRFPVANLTSDLLKALRDSWIDEEQSSRSRATALRNWTNVHSCLQQAFLKKSNGITSPAAWQTVPRMAQEFEGRKLHFSDEDAVAIIEHVRGTNAFAADYLEGIYRFGTRPGGELYALRIRHFNAENRNLAIQPRSETVRAKNGGRVIGISKLGLAFITRVIGDRKGSEFLFTQDGVTQLDENFSRAVIKPLLLAAVRDVLGAGAFEGDDALKEEEVVPYAFRHTFISRRAARGMPAGRIALVCGTSEYMIKKNYEHCFPSETEQWLNDTDPKPQLTVVKKTA